ncbi:MAG: hypothetical protein KAJ19_29635 [Gammaproteobacteria bacterium]|nr:hypothetical protein [Gammaproteobacteria bacterium]
MTNLDMFGYDDDILKAWGARNKDKSDHDNMVRISNAFNVKLPYVHQLLEQNGRELIYELVIEDLTTLGHMGSSSTVIGRKLFSDQLKAKAYAEKNYGEKIKWTGYNGDNWTSGDLSYVMYSIHGKTVE